MKSSILITHENCEGSISLTQRRMHDLWACSAPLILRSCTRSIKYNVHPTTLSNPAIFASGKLVQGPIPKPRPRMSKRRQKVDQLSDVEYVPTNTHSSQVESQLYILGDNAVVIKMMIKGRSPTMRHVSRTHRVALDSEYLRALQATFLNDQLLKKDDSVHSSTIQRIWHRLRRNWDAIPQELQGKTEGDMKREPLNTSIPLHHFQSGGGMLKNPGGTYSHSGMMDKTRFLIWEMHLGRFPDSTEFQCWKVNFKTQAPSKNSRSSTLHAVDQRSREKQSIDELSTSRSITGWTDFPDYDMLDAMIASALKKRLTHVHFRKKGSVEEQRAQNSDRILRGRQIAYMIYEHFSGTRRLWSGIRSIKSIQKTLTGWWRSRFRQKMGPSSFSSSWNTHRNGLGGFF